MHQPKDMPPQGPASGPELHGLRSRSELSPPSEGHLRDAFNRMMPIVTNAQAFNDHLRKITNLPPQRLEALVVRAPAGIPFLENSKDILDDGKTNNFPVRWALAKGTEPVAVRLDDGQEFTIKIPIKLTHEDVLGIRNGTFTPTKIQFGSDITDMEAYHRAMAAFPDYFVPLTESMSRFASDAAFSQKTLFKTTLRKEYEEPLYVAWQILAPLVDANDPSYANFIKAGGQKDWYMIS